MFPVAGWARDPGSNKRGIMCEVEEKQNINIIVLQKGPSEGS